MTTDRRAQPDGPVLGPIADLVRPAGRSGRGGGEGPEPGLRRPGGPLPGLPVLLAAIGAALGALAVALYVGGAIEPHDPELSDPGRLTTVAQPVAKFTMNAAGTVAVGLLLMAAFFLPSAGRELPPRAQACLRAASSCAVLWSLAALATAVLSFAVLIGESGLTTLTSPALPGYLTDVTQGRAFVTVALLAAVIAVAAHLPRTPAGAGLLLVVAVIALLPPVFTGHTATTPDHALAVFSLSIHVVGVALWVGGLAVLVAAGVRAPGVLREVVPRYSTLAFGCFAAVAVSGLLSAWLRIGGTLAALGSGYGLLVVAKAAAIVLLGLFGRWHRQVGIPALSGPARGRGFARIAAVEVVVMAAAMGLATGLARSHAPETDSELGTRAALLLGYDLPGPADLQAYVLGSRPDPLFLTLIAVAAVAYAVGVLRLRRAGGRWPATRIIAWYAGLVAVLIVTCGGLARYSMVLFSAHVAQHLLLTLAVPLLLLPGAPVTLALRTAGRRRAGDGGRSPRDVLVAVLRGRVFEVLAGPWVAPAICVASLYGFYFTPLFGASLRSHLLHSVLMVLFVLVGMVGLWPLTGPRALPGRTRTLLALALVAAHALFGYVFLTSTGVLAADWYAALGRVWGASPLEDQRATNLVVWVIGGLSTLPLLVTIPARVRVLRNGPGLMNSIRSAQATPKATGR